MKKMKGCALAAAFAVVYAGVLAAQETPKASTEQPTAGAAPSPTDAAPSAPKPAAPAGNGSQPKLPDVEVIQEQKQPAQAPVEVAAPKPKKKPAPVVQAEPEPAPKPKKKPAVAKAKPKPAPEPPPAAAVEPAKQIATEPIVPNYGSPAAQGAAERAASGPSSPSDPTRGLVPADLSKFSSSASRVTAAQIDAKQPRTVNELLHTVPGVHVVNDDGSGRHGGIGMRGSPPRRGRKILHMEDGQPINMSLWIDPSIHYTPPVERLEGIDVLRGTVITYGPNNNHGAVNFRNLSPFGPNESEVSFEIGSVKNEGADADHKSANLYGLNNKRHFHTRQMLDNVGVVLSYTGSEADGAWDTERLRYNDFYGALGWRGVDQDFQFSAVYLRERDNYDEANLTGEEGDAPGDVEREFFNEIGHCKTCFNPGSVFNTYNGDIVKLQGVHNYYVDDNTTITSRLYGFHHRRDRYQNFGGFNPADEAGSTLETEIEGDEVFVPEGTMLGRMRTYRQFGAEMRGEWANRPFLAGMSQDIQAGIRYEYNDFTNRNFFGRQGQILGDGDKTGTTVFDTDTDANAYSAFIQTAIHVTTDFAVTPGVRLDHYRISRDVRASTAEEGEAEVQAPCPDDPGETCAVLEGFSDEQISESFNKTHVLPGVALSYSGFFKSTIYGGYHRGLTMGVLREANTRFPPTDELGDNFQIGFRSTAVRGLTIDIAAFHHRIQDFQIKGAATDASGNNVYTTIDSVHINGFEVGARLDTNDHIRSPFNLYFEGNYTLSDAKIKQGSAFALDDVGLVQAVDLAGNDVPEVPRHFAHLTVGLAHAMGWDVSASYTYRGAFFTDETNIAFGEDPTGEDGGVPGVWLLSARASMKLADSGATLFVHGENLTDKLYITDREDGIKPGQGRTIWGGLKYKF